ncbi:MAG: isochorismatase family protein [Gemmatimonadota bacterium]|nr:isochorismatase family protein [Gemmatimonadota bacterium]
MLRDRERTGGTPSGPLVGWVVDVQNDFMLPPEDGGRLYVADPADPADEGAEAVRPAIEAAVAWMRDHCDALVFTGDWHGYDDEEIDPDDPDPAAGTYPPHCMGRSDDPAERAGAEILVSVRPHDPVILDRDADADEARRAARLAVEERRPVWIRKNRFDVFRGNPLTDVFVEALTAALGGDPRFVLAGVARDVCVTQAVDGLQARGHRTVALRDATHGLGLESEEETLARWARGGDVVTLEELRTRLG